MSKSVNIGGKGGARPGAGRPKKALSEKIETGNPGGRELRILDWTDYHEDEMPEPHGFIDEDQKWGDPLEARAIYEDVWNWLHNIGCSKMVYSGLIERYAMSAARWIQLERLISRTSPLSKHPTTGKSCQSPLVAESIMYQNQANRLWTEIFQIVKENCTVSYSGRTPQDDTMDRLLRARGGGDG